MVHRIFKQAIVGTTLSGILAGLTGCTSLIPPEPTPLVETSPPKVVRRVPVEQKVVRKTPVAQKAAPKRVVKKKVITPVEEQPVTAPPVIVPPLGGGGSGGSGGGGWG
ncbi:hypothetical protein EOC93_01835 [Mesorhizobium sp. M6A.T.Ce.TU.002.03.1.1]|nr:hypothetical protein EOC93_01835 [Mesorhizobium sp. M6A.T.Ce.TU.002.03.1.1]RWP77685.1 MAG: hypothetical protein EOR09_07965 [Mesorhizobium sp.]